LPEGIGTTKGMQIKVLCNTTHGDAKALPGPHRGRKGKISKIKNSYQKFLLLMKLAFLLFTILLLQAWSNANAQAITLSVKNTPLENVFNQIRKQSAYSFIYTHEELAASHLVTLSVKDADIEQVLKICFENQPLSYTIEENHIILKIKKGEPVPPETKPQPTLIDVKGRVVNQQGEPVEGVSIKVKGTDRGTSSDGKGEFELKRVDENAFLIFSGTNVETYETKINANLSVVLKTRISKLDEIQIIGYGT
jgi:TonB-dependent starch-binding outer membrane protein SusC